MNIAVAAAAQGAAGLAVERDREERAPRGGGGGDLCTKPSWTAVQVWASLLLKTMVCADRSRAREAHCCFEVGMCSGAQAGLEYPKSLPMRQR